MWITILFIVVVIMVVMTIVQVPIHIDRQDGIHYGIHSVYTVYTLLTVDQGLWTVNC